MASSKVSPPRVAESAVHFECVLSHRHEIKNKEGVTTATLVLGEVRTTPATVASNSKAATGSK